MKVVFFGSSKFAVPSLKALASSGHKILCVVTQPDRLRGRGLHLEGTAVKICARAQDFEIFQPKNTNADEAIEFLKQKKADLFVVVSFGQILSQKILDIPKIFCINAHASLLPKYRGAAPINWAIINGEKKSGVTIIKMTKDMDAGPIIKQKEIAIEENDTSISLEDNLSKLTADLLLNCISSIENDDYRLTEQNEGNVSFAPKLKKQHGLIDWNQSARDIYNLIRGCQPWPGAYSYYESKLLKIYKAEILELPASSFQLPAGQVTKADKEGIFVVAGKDCLIIQELQIEGKRKMNTEEFIAGHRISVGKILGKRPDN